MKAQSTSQSQFAFLVTILLFLSIFVPWMALADIVDPQAIVDDIQWGGYWSDTIDMSNATVYYSDPNVASGGSGTRNDPFPSLESMLASGDYIQRRNSSGMIVNRNAPVAPGDVIVLMQGNHGDCAIESYYNYVGYYSDYTMLIADPDATAPVVLGYLRFGSSRGWIVYGVVVEKLRDQFDSPGNGFDDSPGLIQIDDDPDSSPSQRIIVVNSTLRSYDGAPTWTPSEWQAKATTAAFVNYSSYVLFDRVEARVVNNAFQLGEGMYLAVVDCTVDNAIGDGIRFYKSSYVSLLGNTIRHLHDEDGPDGNHVDGIQASKGSVSIYHAQIERNLILQYSENDVSAANLSGILGAIDDSNSNGNYVDFSVKNNIVVTSNWNGIRLVRIQSSDICNNTVVIADSSHYDFPLIRMEAAVDVNVANNVAGNVVLEGTGVATNNQSYARDFSSAGFLYWQQGVDPSTFDLHFGCDSQLLDAGSASYSADDDFDGVARPQGDTPDVGAYELVQDPDLSVSISGRSTCIATHSYTWTANVSGGAAPFEYVWYWKTGCSGSPVQVGTGSQLVHSFDSDGCLQVVVTSSDCQDVSAGMHITVEEDQDPGLGRLHQMETFGVSSVGPNPFNPMTTIQFVLPAPANTTLTLHDLRGRVVATVIEGRYEAGSHDVLIDGSRLASGTYIYRLVAGNQSDSGRIMLVR
ncbi:MAG: T9SS type A sorting domain-containing protein [Candidatus Krumholzibacteriia bacterium]